MAYQFNGTQGLQNGSSTIFQVGTAFTCSAFVNHTATGNLDVICSYYFYDGATPEQGWVFRFNNADRISWRNVNTGAQVDSTATIAQNAFAHAAFTVNSGTVTLYINGTARGSGSTGSLVYANAVYSIGMRNDTSSAIFRFNGHIAENAIWNAALTDAEILSISRGFTADQIRPQSLQFYAPLVRNLQDVRGGRTITNVNSATVAAHPRIIGGQ